MDTEDVGEIPQVRLDVIKDGHQIETINLNMSNLFKFGRDSAASSTDFVHLLHESISPIHAALAIDKDQGLVLIDLGSEMGTFLNGKRLSKNIPVPVRK